MSLSDVVGQDHIARLLASSIKSSRLAGAYLLTGEEGTGKRYLAYQFAKALNCAESSGDSCDRCLPCRKIDHGNHPDVREVSDEGPSIKIDSIRKLRDEINLKPFEGRWKVFIIPDAERLTLSAANCLLKTLEEPPERSLLLLTAANPSRIMPTVRSRCQTLPLRPLGVEAVENALVGRWGFPPEEARSRAIASGGRMGEAIKTDQSHIRRDGVVELVKSTDLKDKTFRFADELSGTKEECLRHLDLLLSCYRDMLLLGPGRGEALEVGDTRNIVNVDIGADLAKEASRLGQPSILKALFIVEETKKQINSNANVRLSLEVMLNKLSVVSYQ
jgi:DNA polymerase-3 subunit delta'